MDEIDQKGGASAIAKSIDADEAKEAERRDLLKQYNEAQEALHEARRKEDLQKRDAHHIQVEYNEPEPVMGLDPNTPTKSYEEIEHERRMLEAEKLSDPIEKDLLIRYNMDTVIWRASMRNDFPYTLGFNTLFGLPFVIPMVTIIVNLSMISLNFTYLNTLIQVLLMSLSGYFISDMMIMRFGNKLASKNLFGRDLNKSGIQKDKPPVPESLGIVTSIIFLCCSIVQQVTLSFTSDRLIEYNAGLLAICMVVLLGFVDDVVELKWRYKLVVPIVASLPLLIAYKGQLSVVMPKFVRGILGSKFLHLGFLYYFYMGNIAIFCTNAINIYAGINGLEVGQSFIIGCFIMIHNVIEIIINQNSDSEASVEVVNNHMFSLTIMIPFLCTSLALLKHNKFPSKVFVGDTFCYCAGMTFAVVGILGHFSKTMMLFFIPQLINFVLSIPQIFGFVHCPRHRLPSFNQENYKLECVHNHFNLINAWLRFFGNANEYQLCNAMIFFQILCCTFGLVVRYFISQIFF